MNQPCELTLEVSLTEPLAKFVFDKKHFDVVYRTVKPKAFEPPPDFEQSVLRSLALSEDEIWKWGETHVEPSRGRPIKGRADISVSAVVNLELRVIADNDPCRHAFIAGWAKQKNDYMLQAQKLAAAASFVPKYGRLEL